MNCFILSAYGFDRSGHYEITLWGKSDEGRAVKILIDNFRPLFFISRLTPHDATATCAQRKSIPLKTFDAQDVDCCYYSTHTAMLDAVHALRSAAYRVYESDIHPVDRYLMERLVRGGCTITGTPYEHDGIVTFRNPVVRGLEIVAPLTVLSLDIETCVADGTIYCIGVTQAQGEERCFMRGEGASSESLIYAGSEKEMLIAFLAYVKQVDPDIIIGWSIIDFDCAMIAKRCEALGVSFSLGREGVTRIVDSNRGGDKQIRIAGRLVLDVPFLLRSYYGTFEQYSLDFVAGEMLGEHKLITVSGKEKIAEINELFAHDKPHLAEYNLSDCRLTEQIFTKAQILPNAIQRSLRAGNMIDRPSGSVAAFDFLYLPILHRKGYVAADISDVYASGTPLTGGRVMDTIPGIYHNVLVLDFKSLYPTLMMTFCIDPLGFYSLSKNRIQGPAGPSFAADENILPEILSELMAARARAKKEKNDALSQAIKIIMNSFYGVLGTPNCRFFNYQIAQAITQTGQFMHRLTCDYIEKSTGFKVIYGDTDSLFILLDKDHDADGAAIGRAIVADVNIWLTEALHTRFGATSRLELEYENNFLHFFMPPIRGSDVGSKKRYCGTTLESGKLELHFKGLESARTDWTEAARDFQHELYVRVFTGQPVEEFVAQTVTDVRSGKLDAKLVYKKRLRKRLDEYTVHVPPHAQAARLLDHPKHVIAYVITRDGPQPIEKQSAPFDYDHYVEAQIRPIAESILSFVNCDFTAIVSGQMDLFG